nr:FtsX-like permease family protein [uncultured Caproiciproducens sp.]
MTFYQRAFRYIQRKKNKSILLFFCFLIIGTLVLCATIILQTAQATNRSIQQKTGSKLVLENRQGKNDISAETVARILELASVTKVNRAASGTAYPADFSPVTKMDSTETDNLTVTLHAYDNTEIDGLFAQEKYRLLYGNPITETQSGILIDSILAEGNQLGIGDQLTFKIKSGATASGKIIGIFFSGMERKQESSIMTAHRIENQIFVDHGLFEALFGKSGFSTLSVYTSNPENLNDLYKQTKLLINDTASITTSDQLYRQMQAPLKQVIRTTSLMLILILVTSVIVISLLLCMWMRTRTKETAVLISIGISKINLFLQAITESLSVFIFSAIGAAAFSRLFSKKLMDCVFSSDSFANIADTHLEGQHLLSLLLLGSVIILIAVGISIFPTLRANPRDTLSKMEE